MTDPKTPRPPLHDLHAVAVLAGLGFTREAVARQDFLLQLRAAEALGAGHDLSTLIAIITPPADVRVIPRAVLGAALRRDDLAPLANRMTATEVPAGSILAFLDCDDSVFLPVPLTCLAEPGPHHFTALPHLAARRIDPTARAAGFSPRPVGADR